MVLKKLEMSLKNADFYAEFEQLKGESP